ncbi:hypothetical protein WJX82_001824 [Trebouxia sp. C0006]
MSTELLTAGSLVQQWSKASQLEWTLAGMFALSLRAGLDPMDLDTTMLLSLLWILESCSSQYNSNLTVITSNYLAYTNVAAALAGPNTPAQIRHWQQDMKASQLELLKRCEWRIHMDLGTDVEAEDLHQSSLNGKYWQTGSSTSHTACPQQETLIPLGQRARNRAVRTKLSW